MVLMSLGVFSMVALLYLGGGSFGITAFVFVGGAFRMAALLFFDGEFAMQGALLSVGGG